MSLSCTVSDILPLVCELTAHLTTYDLEKYFGSNLAVEIDMTVIQTPHNVEKLTFSSFLSRTLQR